MPLLLVLFLATAAPAEPVIEVELDIEAARAILAALGSNPADEDLERIASLPGVEALIKQGARFSPDTYTRANFIAGLRTFAAGQAPKPDPFNFARIQTRSAETAALLRSIESDPEAFKRDLIARMKTYAPAGSYDTRLTLVAGGSSDGFSPGRGQLYVALDFLRDDREGLLTLASHELYHAIQAIALDRSGVQRRLNALTGRPREATSLLLTTMKEGTGSVVGDPLVVKNAGSYITWFSEKYRRNLDRLPQNFALFESLLFRLANDDIALRDLYSLGFAGNWDSPLYFVGYRIAKVVEKYDGRGAIKRMWSASPVAFFKRYAALATEHHGDRDIVKFSASTLKVLDDLDAAYSATR